MESEPQPTIEQPVDVGSPAPGDVGGLVVEIGDTTMQMVDVPVEGDEIGAVVAVVPGALDDP